MKKHNRKKSIRKWFRRNKKKILIAGGVALTAAGGVLIFKNKEALLSFINNGEAVANAVDMLVEDNSVDVSPTIKAYVNPEITAEKTPINDGDPFIVREFIRNLPDDWHASPEKQAEAEALGIILGEHQTLVSSYYKNAV